MKKHLESLLNGIACYLLPTQDLLETKKELEEYIEWGKDGEIDCTQEDIADSEKQLARVNKVLEKRQSRV